MKYKALGTTGLNASILGFGCMRLPEKDGRVDRDRSTPLLRRAFELGVNFFDTAIGYCGGDSQAALGEAVEPFRDKVILSTKNHHHAASPSDWRRHLEESLKKLRTGYLDIYNHHGIQWNTFVEHLDPAKDGLTKEMIRAKEEGLIRHIGFSFHDKPESLVKLVDTGYYETVILQYNLLDQANADAIAHAASKGMGIVVMGPVGGGRLGVASEAIVELTGGAAQSTPEAALRFVWGHPGVSVALSGMQNLAMLEQNAALSDSAQPFTPAQIALLNRLVDERRKKSGLYCTGCRYRSPVCPEAIQIPEQLDLLNALRIYGLEENARHGYQRIEGKAIDCIACGRCAEKCPQNIDIPARMKEVVRLFDPAAGTLTVDTAIDSLRPDGTFSLRVTARNLGETARGAAVSLSPASGVSIEPRASPSPRSPLTGKNRPGSVSTSRSIRPTGRGAASASTFSRAKTTTGPTRRTSGMCGWCDLF